MQKEMNMYMGISIEYANFFDLNKDGYKEIIVLSKAGSIYDLHIYSYKNSKISKIYSLTPFIENLDVKIKISDIDNDRKEDILLVTFDSTTKKADVSVLDFDKKLNLKGSVEIDDVKNINDLYITIGNVSPKKKGIVLDIPTIYNEYKTQIVLFDNERIKKSS